MIQEQLLLWYKNSYYYDTRTVIIVIQEQLLLGYNNSYSYDVRTTIFRPIPFLFQLSFVTYIDNQRVTRNTVEKSYWGCFENVKSYRFNDFDFI